MSPSFIFRKFSCSVFFILPLIFTALNTSAQLFNQHQLKLISRQFSFTEGPAVNKKGDVYFTDQPNNKIWKYSADGKLSLFKNAAGRSNGLYFDSKGQLLACADEHNELWSYSSDGKAKVLLSNVGGKKLNGPNDLWADRQGGIYFTDPYYQRDYWTRQRSEIEGQKVFYLSAKKGAKARIVAEDLIKPNGIVGSADGKYLYVADIQQNKIFRYTIAADGGLRNRTLIINQGSDGMTIDQQGNFYLTGKGVSIYSPEGKLLGHIDVKEPWTANVCFGGKNRTDLFITATTAIYTIPMRTRGVE